jgi:hypothetical protein
LSVAITATVILMFEAAVIVPMAELSGAPAEGTGSEAMDRKAMILAPFGARGYHRLP